jgi:CRP-like cAMP-binding protein
MIKDSDFLQFKRAMTMVSSVEAEFFTELRAIAKYRKLQKNDFFSSEGDLNKQFGFVVDGALRIFHLSEDGQEHNKHFLVQNNFIAASIRSDQKSIVSIQALSPSKLICIEYDSFIVLLKKYNKSSDFIQKLIEGYLEDKQIREINLLSKSAEENYCSFLDGFPELKGKIADYHIASYIGVTPTQLSRIRKKLKNINICK